MLVVCNGMPRSGSTLQYNVVRLLLEHGKLGTAKGYAGPRASQKEYVPTEQLLEWADDRMYHLVKIHPVHAHLRSLLSSGHTRVCYIFRDLRDVAVSRKLAWGDDRKRLFEGLDRSVNWYWTLAGLRDAYPGRVLWQRYEDVMEDLHSAVSDTAVFLNASLPDSALVDIASACSVDAVKPIVDQGRVKLQLLLQELKTRDPALAGKYLSLLGRGKELPDAVFKDPKSLLSYNQISPHNGAVGVWKGRLDEGILREICERYKDWFAHALGAASSAIL